MTDELQTLRQAITDARRAHILPPRSDPKPTPPDAIHALYGVRVVADADVAADVIEVTYSDGSRKDLGRYV